MKRLRRRESRAERLRDAVVEAALSALGGEAGTTSDKRALTGARAVATGAVLYTVVRAGFAGGRFVRGRPDPRGDHGEIASPNATTPRPGRTPTQENGPPPSLRLPNRRWSRMAAERS
jgi:hypothetical protein